jgi:hypothetical protein
MASRASWSWLISSTLALSAAGCGSGDDPNLVEPPTTMFDATVIVGGGTDAGQQPAPADAASPMRDAAVGPLAEAGALQPDAGTDAAGMSMAGDAGSADSAVLAPDGGGDAGPPAAAWKPKCVK